MANLKDFEIKIPNLGEAESTEIIEISVKVGDVVNENDPLIVLESEKAAMEVPSDFQGVIKAINVKEGDSVKEGQPFIIIEAEEKDESKEIDVPANEIKDNQARNQSVKNITDQESFHDFSGINAGPAVRKIAREMEIDLTKISGTGKNSMITKEDLKNFIHSFSNQAQPEYSDINSLSEFGDFSIEKQTKIRALGAKNLHRSWISIPHVTHFEEVDITLIEKQRSDLNSNEEIKITPLAYVVLKVTKALKEFPIFNSSLVGDGEIMIRKYINIGIAVDTPSGLLVPVIKDADKLTINEVAQEIKDKANKALNKKIFQKDLEGGTFSISSLGALGGTGFTPIINPPEVAILSVSRSKKELYLSENEIKEKTILPIALSYDHRVINGADAGKFMNFLKSEIEKGV